jgi:hypothetical protein
MDAGASGDFEIVDEDRRFSLPFDCQIPDRRLPDTIV